VVDLQAGPQVLQVRGASNDFTLFGVGLLLLGVGGGAVAGGVVIFSQPGTRSDGEGVGGTVLVGVGGIAAVAGVVLTIVGGTNVHTPAEARSPERRAGASGPVRFLGLGAAPDGHGGGALGAGFAF
jgi:hypothetical protein